MNLDCDWLIDLSLNNIYDVSAAQPPKKTTLLTIEPNKTKLSYMEH